MRLGVIGSGSVVGAHLDALKIAGFTPEVIGASLNSTSATLVAEKYKIKYVIDDANDIKEYADSLDAVLVCCAANQLFNVLESLHNFRVPILVEKPVFTDLKQISNISAIRKMESRVLVGYNRRFLSTVTSLKREIENQKSGILEFKVFELSTKCNPTKQECQQALVENLVHMLDLFFHLSSLQPSQCKIKASFMNGKVRYLEFHGTNNKIYATFKVYFGHPGKNEVIFHSGGIKIQLKPLERLRFFQGMEVVEPTRRRPLRSYQDKLIKEEIYDNKYYGVNYKPGFIEQARNLKKFVETGERGLSSSLEESLLVSKMAFKLIKKL